MHTWEPLVKDIDRFRLAVVQRWNRPDWKRRRYLRISTKVTSIVLSISISSHPVLLKEWTAASRYKRRCAKPGTAASVVMGVTHTTASARRGGMCDERLFQSCMRTWLNFVVGAPVIKWLISAWGGNLIAQQAEFGRCRSPKLSPGVVHVRVSGEGQLEKLFFPALNCKWRLQQSRRSS